MAVARLPVAAPDTLDEALVEGRRLIGDGSTIVEATTDLLDRIWEAREWSDDDLLRKLAQTGLQKLLSSGLHDERTHAKNGDARPAVLAVLSPDVASDPDVLAIPAYTAEGEMRVYLDWTVKDWRAWASYCEGQTNGWFARQEGSREIADLLQKQKVERARDLTPAQVEKVRAIVRGFRA